jgi:serine/threonine protein kinase
MGEVFRGTDTRLGRPVAIKISAEEFSGRFEREARAISALNHPHICTLYDVGTLPSGSGYLVTELVEGESLSDWLKRSPEVQRVAIAEQVLDGASAAHGAASSIATSSRPTSWCDPMAARLTSVWQRI